MTTEQKEKIISTIINDDIKAIIGGYEHGDNSYINDLLGEGMTGYWYIDDEQLLQEIEERGINVE